MGLQHLKLHSCRGVALQDVLALTTLTAVTCLDIYAFPEDGWSREALSAFHSSCLDEFGYDKGLTSKVGAAFNTRHPMFRMWNTTWAICWPIYYMQHGSHWLDTPA